TVASPVFLSPISLSSFFYLLLSFFFFFFFFFQAEDGIRDRNVTGVQTCALPIYRPATRRDPPGLHARERVGRVAVRVHLVEHGADDVEFAREAGPCAHHKQADTVADVNLQRVVLVLECPPVEHDVARFALERLLPIGLARQRAVAALHVELALHNDEFLVNLARPAALRVHDDREIHALHQVQQHRRRATVHEIGAGIARGELERQRVLRQDRPERLVHRDPCGVEVDRVRHRGLVDEANPHQVALAHPDYRAGNGPPEGPALVRHALRDLDRRVADRDTELLHWCGRGGAEPGVIHRLRRAGRGREVRHLDLRWTRAADGGERCQSNCDRAANENPAVHHAAPGWGLGYL